MPSAASWERNSSLDSWHVAEIEYPGVYVEEVPLGVAPIAGVETSTTGFIGAVGSAEPCAGACGVRGRSGGCKFGMALAKLGSDAGKS